MPIQQQLKPGEHSRVHYHRPGDVIQALFFAFKLFLQFLDNMSHSGEHLFRRLLRLIREKDPVAASYHREGKAVYVSLLEEQLTPAERFYPLLNLGNL